MTSSPLEYTESALNLLLRFTQVEMHIHVNGDNHATEESNSNSNRQRQEKIWAFKSEIEAGFRANSYTPAFWSLTKLPEVFAYLLL